MKYLVILVALLLIYSPAMDVLHQPPSDNEIVINLDKEQMSGVGENVGVGMSTSVIVTRNTWLRNVVVPEGHIAYIGGIYVLPKYVLGYNFQYVHYLILVPLIVLTVLFSIRNISRANIVWEDKGGDDFDS